MKIVPLLFAGLAVCALAQAPKLQPLPSEIPPDTVLATINGKKLTYGDFEKYLRAMPPQVQQNAMRNRRQFIQQFALMQKLSEIAEKNKLDQKSPYKEALEFNRMNILTQAQIQNASDSFPVIAEDIQKHYEAHKSEYEQVKLRVIYLPFTTTGAAGPDGKKRLTEPEAKAKAEELVKQIKGGANFVKLVKEYSEDETSKAKDGDFGTLSRSDNLPESIRSVVFALKAGDVSEPVKQPNGFYIFRADSVTAKPLAEVHDQIVTDIKNQRLKEWLDATTKSLDIKYENDMIFSAKPVVEQVPLPPK
ncbi:MAG TPA: peptidylprolyl isomerase [Bryobacteraceae bacterium]|nr:peptidylprolyl isomerase [Bryobacteraceae bacterium]